MKRAAWPLLLGLLLLSPAFGQDLEREFLEHALRERVSAGKAEGFAKKVSLPFQLRFPDTQSSLSTS